MTEYAIVGASQFAWIITGAVLFIVVPVVIAIVWMIKKKEPITTILVGAVAFALFAMAIEKPIQNALVFPTLMGLPEQGFSRFLNLHPVLMALVLGLFPGVFEETGRFVAFKTVLKGKKNRETSISYGIGHGGFEVMFLLGLTYLQYILYAVMINSGAFGMVVEQVAAQAPDQVETLEALAASLAVFSFGGLALAIVERVAAVAFHIANSILVFYACKDTKKFWLYPLAIALHTGLDFILGLSMLEVISLPSWALEAVFLVYGLATFAGAYILLYKKDVCKELE